MIRNLLAVALAVAAGIACADDNYTANPRGKTTASKVDYTTGHGRRHKNPRTYEENYYSNYNGYALSPYLLTTPEYVPRVVAPTRQYSAVEYGNLVEKFYEAQGIAPAGMTSGQQQSIVHHEGDAIAGNHDYSPVKTKIVDVLDRGTLVVGTREEVRLRGVRIGSENSPDDISRVYAREAMKRIRELIGEDNVTMVLDTPVRDCDGAILVVASLKDGTELNRLLLSEGLGQLQASDFADDVNYDALSKAEKEARAKHRGLWSRKFTNSGQ